MRWSERYQVLERLRDSEYEKIYRAIDRVEQRRVMLNIRVQTMAQNVRLCQRMQHPHLMNIYEVAQRGSHLFVVMEDEEALPLDELLRREAPFSVEKAVTVTCQMCDALQYIHGYGRQHRQISPQHIFGTPQGVFRLLYLDCQAVGESESERADFPYLAPECLQGVYVDDSSDLYSLSVVLYQMLTGQLPGQNRQTLSTDLFDPDTLGVDIPEPFIPLLRKGLSTRRYKRFRSAEEMKEALLSVYRKVQPTHHFVQAPAIRSKAPVWRGCWTWLILITSISLFVISVSSDHHQLSTMAANLAHPPLVRKTHRPWQWNIQIFPWHHHLLINSLYEGRK